MVANEIGKIFNVKRERTFSPMPRISVDDFPVTKVIETVEGTIQKTPVNGSDIVNKAYVDSVAGGLPQGVLPVGSIPNLSDSYIPQGVIPAGSLINSIPQGQITSGSLPTNPSITGNLSVAGSIILSGDNSTADTAYVPMILYNTDATPPAASGFPIGTLYIQYTA